MNARLWETPNPYLGAPLSHFFGWFLVGTFIHALVLRPRRSDGETNEGDILVFDTVYAAFTAHLIILANATIVFYLKERLAVIGNLTLLMPVYLFWSLFTFRRLTNEYAGSTLVADTVEQRLRLSPDRARPTISIGGFRLRGSHMCGWIGNVTDSPLTRALLSILGMEEVLPSLRNNPGCGPATPVGHPAPTVALQFGRPVGHPVAGAG